MGLTQQLLARTDVQLAQIKAAQGWRAVRHLLGGTLNTSQADAVELMAHIIDNLKRDLGSVFDERN
jgi:hypothetical protein